MLLVIELPKGLLVLQVDLIWLLSHLRQLNQEVSPRKLSLTVFSRLKKGMLASIPYTKLNGVRYVGFETDVL